MGQPAPYDDDEDSSLNESDHEEIVAVMSDDKFEQQVNDLIRSIVTGEYTMDAALFNIQQIKHGFSKNNDACQGVIVPALLSEVANLMTEDMSNKQKLEVLNNHLPEFKEMLTSFMTGNKEDEENIVYLVAMACSKKMEILGPCFYLILQVLYNEDIIHEEAILAWVSSAR